MTDYELLEFVAKVAGIDGTVKETADGQLWLFRNDSLAPWNPLTNNSDARTLAIKIHAYDCVTATGIRGINGETNEERLVKVRRAIAEVAVKLHQY